MAVPLAEQTKLFARSGNRCAFEKCGRLLVARTPEGDGTVLLGEVAHIVAERPNGPRGESSLSVKERNRHQNLIVLCNVHHQLVDSLPQTYTVERLRALKADHELRMEQVLGAGPQAIAPPPFLEETLYSTALPVDHLPNFVFSAEALTTELKEIWKATDRRSPEETASFIVRGARIYSFQNLNRTDGPFASVTKPGSIEKIPVRSWIADPDSKRWFVELLNRSMNDYLRRKGLHFDREHRRYYFKTAQPGEEREVRYRTQAGRRARRKVVWAPESRRTGEKRNYWLHRAIGVRFWQCTPTRWILTLRPEYRVTQDGETPLTGTAVARRINRRMNRAFNYDLLQDIHFWRDYITAASPRILISFGEQGQHIHIRNRQLEAVIEWPGMPEEFQREFSNVEYPDNLFTFAELRHVEEQDEEDIDTSEDLTARTAAGE